MIIFRICLVSPAEKRREHWNCNTDDAVTIIVGAGAVLDYEHKGVVPSVKNITDDVLKIPVQKVDGSEWLLINELYKYIYDSLKQVGNPESRKFIHPQINFEDLLHALEMCLTFSSCWHDEYMQWSSFPLFDSLTDPNFFYDVYRRI